ncbi:hypothetical protein F2Q68_00026134 [Brassica cretica]|uniref:Uncharacterized protein n=1 Tax=Brassica cretica TaxID=69181 RepID=A0A8S9IGW3_BRACR|nr:hypothetical protein F2Q68_00026134 [Brassica cretica]
MRRTKKDEQRKMLDEEDGETLGAGRIIAQFIVMGTGILGRAFFQAYRQAIASMF